MINTICKTTRVHLMKLDVSEFATLEHLESCEECRTFANELRALEAEMESETEAFVAGGDFEADWARAKEQAAPQKRGSPWRWAVAPLLMAALALFVMLPDNRMPDGPTPEMPAVMDPAPDTGRVAPPPTIAPAPAPRPRPRPAVRPSPRPSPAPLPQPSPAPEPEPGPGPATVKIASDAPYSGIEVKCPSGYRQRANFAGGSATVQYVPYGEMCDVFFKGGPLARTKIKAHQTITCTFVNAVANCR